jgi:general stress protein YciG
MNCPSCNTPIEDAHILKAAASIMGARGRGDCKARDPKKMSEAGKKGGWKKGRPRKKL